MATFVWDFDSTLIPGESLEDAFRLMGLDEDTLTQITDISRRGMAGEVPFKDSLTQRLEIARPHRSALEQAGAILCKACTKGVPQIIHQMHRDGHEVWIVSGGFKDLIDVCAKEWGVPTDRVYAVSVNWDEEGNLVSIVEDGFEINKVDGLRRAGVTFQSPSLMIGDGVTDFQLRDEGFVDIFCAYIEHVQRKMVIDKADHIVSNMVQMRLLMTEEL